MGEVLETRLLPQPGGTPLPRAFDEQGQPRDMVGLNVGLEDGDDWRADCGRGLDVAGDKLGVWVDDSELAL